MRASRVLEVRPAGPDHQVVSIAGNAGGQRHTPCGGCPWRVDQAGSFPAEAFVHSARTAYDMSQHMFSCHESGSKKPATCAGFLLRGAEHNLSVRLQRVRGEEFSRLDDGGHELFENYRATAVANGVDPKHPALRDCRD